MDNETDELEVIVVESVSDSSEDLSPAINVFGAGDESALLPSASPNQRLQLESLKSVIENYLGYYALGKSHTARAKRYDLQHFLKFLAGPGGNPDNVLVSSWTLQATKDFVDHRLTMGEAPSTVSRRLATVKHFGRTLAERIHDFVNPAREAKGPTIQPSRPHGLERKEVELLRQAVAAETTGSEVSYNNARNAFLLELLMATGLRADEVRLLVMGQISDNLEWLKNVKTKGKKFRNVYLDSEIRVRLKFYLDFRAVEIKEKAPALNALAKNEQDRLPVLLSFYGAGVADPSSYGLSPKTIWRIIASFGKKAQTLSSEEISNLHPHKLRHTFAHGLLESSKDVRLVAQALGHSDVRTTMRYTERGDEEIAKAIEGKLQDN